MALFRGSARHLVDEIPALELPSGRQDLNLRPLDPRHFPTMPDLRPRHIPRLTCAHGTFPLLEPSCVVLRRPALRGAVVTHLVTHPAPDPVSSPASTPCSSLRSVRFGLVGPRQTALRGAIGPGAVALGMRRRDLTPGPVGGACCAPTATDDRGWRTTMITDFVPVPDWPGEENVDGGLAVGDLDGDGIPELVVFVIDSLPGDNAGRYRVGRGFDATGTVTGEWGPWQQLPDWPFFENAGGGIALVDLDGSGALDMVVAVVDAPEGPNTGFVRVGRNLDADGVATGGWGPWQQLPDWGFLENVSADCAVADVDGDGRPSWCCSRSRPGPGRTPRSTAGRASPRTARRPTGRRGRSYPTGRSDENAGCRGRGRRPRRRRDARAARAGRGRPGPGERRATTASAGGWTAAAARPTGGGRGRSCPAWPFWENQGGAVDARGRRRRRRARPGRARRRQPGRAERRPRHASCSTWRPTWPPPPSEGVWRLLEIDSGVLAVHAALLPTGERAVLRRVEQRPEIAAAAHQYGTPGVALPGARDQRARPRPSTCSAVATRTLPDGRLLAAGGTERYDPFLGLTQAVVFDPAAGPADAGEPDRAVGEWTDASPTWQPAAGTRPSSRARTGTCSPCPASARTASSAVVPERFRGRAGWTRAAESPPWPLYAHLFLLADGRLFYSGGQYGANNGQRPGIWDPDARHRREVTGLPEPGLPQPVRQRAAAAGPGPAGHDHRWRRLRHARRGHHDRDHRDRRPRRTADPVYVPRPAAAPRPDAPVRHAAARPDRARQRRLGDGGETATTSRRTRRSTTRTRNTWRGAAASRVPGCTTRWRC